MGKNKKHNTQKIFFIIATITLILLTIQTNEALTIRENVALGINMTIWDITDTESRWSSENPLFPTNVSFNVNLTNLSQDIINETCEIKFNYTGVWSPWDNMTYNGTGYPYWYIENFTYKGHHWYEINCSNSSFSMNLTENFTVANSEPAILKRGDGYVDFDGNFGTLDFWQCTEDILCTYDFSGNVSEYDTNDILTYSFGANTTLTNYSLNETTGLLTINITLSGNETGEKQIELGVVDTESPTQSAFLNVNVTEVNDAPVIKNLQNQTINMSDNFDLILYATDEEGNSPFIYNVIFESCIPANWSTRNSSDCDLFNLTAYNDTAVVLNFTPARNDVGKYLINITVMDNATGTGFLNSTSTFKWNLTVNNVNSWPYFSYLCDNERNTTEDQNFTCQINVTDIDETENITFQSDHDWFVNLSNMTVINFNTSYLVNFTPSDVHVGNWTINVSITDNSELVHRTNSTIISFFIENLNDSVSINPTINFSGYNGNKYSIFINATDDDLLIINKTFYDEILHFETRNLSGANITWINITKQTPEDNRTQIRLRFEANATTIGNTTVNLTVRDANNYSVASTYFDLALYGNSVPAWDANFSRNYTLTEDTEFFINLSQYVNDSDGEQINFSYSNHSLTQFPNFFTGSNVEGIINFTPTDDDIGFHQVIINATDGKAGSEIIVNLTINYINDAPAFAVIQYTNPVYEENATIFNALVQDEDLKITQKAFYDESLTLSQVLSGPNQFLLNFTFGSGPSPSQPNLTIFSANFTPNKSDVGSYTVNLTVRDVIGIYVNYSFTFTVSEIAHEPYIRPIPVQNTGILRNFTLQFNVTDAEDNNTDDGGTFNFTYVFLNGTDFFNETVFNDSIGFINITFNESQAGSYRINFTVRDSSGLNRSKNFWVNVYDNPYIISTYPTYLYAVENETANISLIFNHSVADDLVYNIYIGGILRNTTNGTSNGINNATITFFLNYSDETTCKTSNRLNITINASNAIFSNSTTINITVNHTNYPVEVIDTVEDENQTSPHTYTLTRYFEDLDVDTNICNNETIMFDYVVMDLNMSAKSPSTFTLNITNWSESSQPFFTLSTTVNDTEKYQIIVNDTYVIAKSNNFTVNLSSPNTETTVVETPVSGSSTGSSGKLVSMKILLPGTIETDKRGEIKVPITLYNNGQTKLYTINLTSEFEDFGKLEGVEMEFARTLFSQLNPGQKQYTNLTIRLDTEAAGDYEVTINASVSKPKYKDWGKFILKIKDTNRTEIEKIIVFTEELIVSNPECAELQEVLDDARVAEARGDLDEAWSLSNEAVRACRKAIEQRTRAAQAEEKRNDIIIYLSFMTLAVLLLIFTFHLFNRMKLKKQWKKERWEHELMDDDI